MRIIWNHRWLNNKNIHSYEIICEIPCYIESFSVVIVCEVMFEMEKHPWQQQSSGSVQLQHTINGHIHLSISTSELSAKPLKRHIHENTPRPHLTSYYIITPDKIYSNIVNLPNRLWNKIHLHFLLNEITCTRCMFNTNKYY